MTTNPHDTTRRDALAASLASRLDACSFDELRVIDAVLAGLERGRAVYGPLDLATDNRDFRREAAEELRDALIYDACILISKQDKAKRAVNTSPEYASAHEIGEGG